MKGGYKKLKPIYILILLDTKFFNSPKWPIWILLRFSQRSGYLRKNWTHLELAQWIRIVLEILKSPPLGKNFQDESRLFWKNRALFWRSSLFPTAWNTFANVDQLAVIVAGSLSLIQFYLFDIWACIVCLPTHVWFGIFDGKGKDLEVWHHMYCHVW